MYGLASGGDESPPGRDRGTKDPVEWQQLDPQTRRPGPSLCWRIWQFENFRPEKAQPVMDWKLRKYHPSNECKIVSKLQLANHKWYDCNTWFTPRSERMWSGFHTAVQRHSESNQCLVIFNNVLTKCDKIHLKTSHLNSTDYQTVWIDISTFNNKRKSQKKKCSIGFIFQIYEIDLTGLCINSCLAQVISIDIIYVCVYGKFFNFIKISRKQSSYGNIPELHIHTITTL